MASKAVRAVVENLKESPDADFSLEKQALPCDFQFVSDICTRANIPLPLKVWRLHCAHPVKSRPLKVEFSTNSNRDSFILSFNRFLSPTIAGQFRPRVRRDMTLPELRLLRVLRQQVAVQNNLAGCRRFYLRDLSIVERKPEFIAKDAPFKPVKVPTLH